MRISRGRTFRAKRMSNTYDLQWEHATHGYETVERLI